MAIVLNTQIKTFLQYPRFFKGAGAQTSPGAPYNTPVMLNTGAKTSTVLHQGQITDVATNYSIAGDGYVS